MRPELTELREWIKANNLDPNKALDELKKWDRKYYSYTIGTNRHIQPGDGMFVTLYGGGRKVSIGEEEFEDLEEDTPEAYGPTMGEVILAALRAWHADTSPKNYRAIAHWTPGNPLPEPINPHAEIKGWSWRYKNDNSGSLEYRLAATSEMEALQILHRNIPNFQGKFSIWEAHANWNH